MKPPICFNTDCFRFDKYSISILCKYTDTCNGYQVSVTKQLLKNLKNEREVNKMKQKIYTRRIWKKPRVKVGGIYKAKLKMLSKDYFAKIKVLKYYKQKLGDMGEGDALKEGYHSLDKFQDIWVEINGVWNNNQIVDVIEFQLLKHNELKEIEREERGKM